MKTGRSGGRQERQQQHQLSYHSHRNKKYDEDDDGGDKSEDSVDSPMEPASPQCLSRDDVLATLGYQAANLPQQSTPTKQAERQNCCRRCGKRVYPLELVDIGDCYHRGCFKCYVCGLQLTLKTFSRAVSDNGNTKEIYCRTHVPKLSATSVGGDAVGIRTALDAQKQASDKFVMFVTQLMRQYEQSPVKYDADALEFKHAREIKQRQKVKRKSSLKTYKDFKKFGIFAAQEALEKKHRLEEDELYAEMVEERRRQMQQLEQALITEREHTVQELIAWFENRGITQKERDAGLKKLEQYFTDKREEEIKHLLEKMAVEEQAAITRLIEKHSQEMLLMIQEKDEEAEEIMRLQEESVIKRDAEAIRHLMDSDETTVKESYEQEPDYGRQDSDEERFEEQESEEEGGNGEEEEEEEEEGEGEENENEKTGREMAAEYEDEEAESFEDNAVGDEGMEYKELLESFSGSWESGDEDERKYHDDNDDDDGHQGDVVEVIETAGDVPISRLSVVSDSDRRQKRQENKASLRDVETQVDVSETRRKSRHEMVEEDTQTEEPSVVPRDKKNKSHDIKPRSRTLSDDDDDAAAADDDDTRRKHRHSKLDKHRHKHHQETPSPSRSRDKKHASQSLIGQQGKHFQVTISMEKIPAQTQVERPDIEEDLPPPYTMRPEICPPACPKSKLYNSPDVFYEFDKRAIKEAQKDPTSFTELVRRLLRKCETELQRVRAIFRWITAKDLNKIEFSEILDTESPMGLLRGIKFGTETYHNLFKRLCSYAGLHCEIIEGYSKGAGYHPGSHLRGVQFRNQWTAVWVEGSWRFINCNWGARHVKRPGDDRSMTYHVDEFYFLTDPEEHIYQHFPDDERWQLLRRPLMLEDFVRLPLVKSPFFNHRLEFAVATESALRAVDGHIDVRLITPTLLGFAAKLRPAKDDGGGSSSLNDRCLVRNIGNMVVVSAALPKPGRYYLDIYVGEDWSSSSMDSACSFRVHCRSVAPSVAGVSYPPGICFGATPDCARCGISEETVHDPVVVVDGKQLSLRLRTPSRSDADVRLTHTMRYWKHETLVDCDRYALLQKRDSAGAAKWIIRCPKAGFYAVSVTASVGDEPARCVYRYLLDCRRPCADAKPMPRATTRWNSCRLVEPLDDELAPRAKVRFRIESSAAVELLVNVKGGAWTSLERSGDVWEALVETGDVGDDGRGRLQVYGRFDAATDKYVPLLDYVVREPSLTDEVRTMLKYM